MRTAILISILLSLTPAVLAKAASDHDVEVRIEQGRLLGSREGTINVFKNIPYATPPVGNLRWKPPQRPSDWSEVRQAKEFGPPCPSIDGSKIQQGKRLSGAYDIFIGVPLVFGSSEDCLHLNVWAPTKAKDAPVMVWIQPLGPSSYPLFDGSAFARDGVIFVSMDYRQLTLGNFAHPALTKDAPASEPLARYQTMDQIAALRWVRKNIAAFGGDARNVTVFGQSAGAASTLQLLTIPSARGFFDKAIVQSGAGWWSPFTLAQMETVGSWVAKEAGLPGADATPEQLRALPVEALMQLGIYSVDGRSQTESATIAMDAERLADVPLLIGWTDFDGSSLRSATPEAFAEKAPTWMKQAYAQETKQGADLGYQMYTDRHVGAPARWIAAKAERGAPSYLYLFSYVRTAKRGKVRGASHGDDIAFVFDSWSKAFPQLALSDEDRNATRIVRSCWISFARTGKPTCEGAPAWPRYTRAADTLMEIGTSTQLRESFRKSQLDAQEAAMHETIREAGSSVNALIDDIKAGRIAVTQ